MLETFVFFDARNFWLCFCFFCANLWLTLLYVLIVQTHLFFACEVSAFATPLKNACAHRPAHGESGAPIGHVTMNRGGEAGAATMVFGMAGMVPGCVVLFFFRCQFYLFNVYYILSASWKLSSVVMWTNYLHMMAFYLSIHLFFWGLALWFMN